MGEMVEVLVHQGFADPRNQNAAGHNALDIARDADPDLKMILEDRVRFLEQEEEEAAQEVGDEPLSEQLKSLATKCSILEYSQRRTGQTIQWLIHVTYNGSQTCCTHEQKCLLLKSDLFI